MNAVEAAQQQWELVVQEPPGQHWTQIDAYIREGLGWTWTPQYKRNGQFAWCGAFVAWCFMQGGVWQRFRAEHFASTTRLYRWSKDKRRVGVAAIDIGDILVVGDPKDTQYYRRVGRHIALVVRLEGSRIAGTLDAICIEGNARGVFPDGSTGEGVVRVRRPLVNPQGYLTALHANKYVPLYGVRPRPSDFQERDDASL